MPTPHRNPSTRRARLQLLRRQRSISRLLATLLAPFCGWSFAQVTPPPTVLNLSATALPQGGQVRLGSATLSNSGAQLLIEQSTHKLGIDWQRFDIGRDARVEFRQPGRDSVALNRVTGNDPSSIFGQLVSNGQVFLTNPNGILFAPGSKVDVGGLIASTLDLSQDDFAAGNLRFEGTGGSVVQQGRIDAERYVALFGGQLTQAGEIVAPGGSVVLASGRAATVALDDSGLLTATVTGGRAGRIEQTGLIDVGTGRVQMTAQSADGQAPSLVNVEGLVRASSIEQRGGEIVIHGDELRTRGTLAADGASGGRIEARGGMLAGRIDVGGTLSARGQGGSGGQIETSAAHVGVDAGVQVDTRNAVGGAGQWLIDPTDFVVSAGSGNATTSGIGASTLQGMLAQTGVTLQTAQTGTEPGNLRVDAAVSWSSNFTLTLSAINDITINANLTATGNSAGLTISAGSGRYTLADGVRISLPGSSPSLSINGQSYVVVNSLSALQAINTDSTTLGRSYALGSDIDASATASMNGGAGFVPIGTSTSFNQSFRGSFDGLGHTISGLTVNRPGTTYAGLFGYAQNGSLRNVTLSGGSIVGGNYTGALVGYLYGNGSSTTSSITNVHSSTPVQATFTSGTYQTVYLGGLAGITYYLTGISRSSVSANVSGDSYYGYVGGLAGYVEQGGSISDSQVTGNVTHQATGYNSTAGYVGGMVGYGNATSLQRVSTTGAVTGGERAGGLAGYLTGRRQTINGVPTYLDIVADASATGAVNAAADASYIGGLIGYANQMPLRDVSASGSVSGASYSGGLVGYYNRGTVLRATASGDASSTYSAGGLIGYLTQATVTDSSASGQVEGTANYAGGLVGYADSSSIVGSRASGDVTGRSTVGGLVGQIYLQDTGEQVVGSSASGNVTSTQYVAGGLIGFLYADNSNADERIALSDTHASGAVRARTMAGGLIGYAQTAGTVIQDSSATGSVTGTGVDGESGNQYLGGLIAQLYDYGAYYAQRSTELRRNFATGAVAVDDVAAAQAATSYGGGLIGYAYSYPGTSARLSVHDNHADGAVALRASSGTAYAGGLVGLATGGSYTHDYASGRVTIAGFGSSSRVGGLIGTVSSSPLISDSVWNTTTTGQATSAGGGTGLTDAQMRQAASFAGWDLTASPGGNSVWRLYEGLSQPLLRGQLTPLTLTLADASKAYDGSASLAGSGLGAGAGPLAHPERILVAGMSPDAGGTLLSGALLYSAPGGYDLTVSGSGTLTVVPRTVTLDGTVADKVYDGNVAAAFRSGAAISGLVAGEDLTLSLGSAVASFANKNAGIDKAVTVTGYAVGDGVKGKAANYTVVGTATADITPKPVTGGSFTATDRVYDGTTQVAVSYSGAALGGVVAGDTVSISGTGATGQLADKRAGQDRLVTVSGITLTGTDAANYQLAGLDTLTVDISPKPLTVGGLTVSNRQYNGSTGVSVNGNAATLTGAVAGDFVGFTTLNLTGTMADRHAGTGKAVVISGLTLTGFDAANYAPTAADLTIDIAPRTVTGYLSQQYNGTAGGYGYKVYDGNADASMAAYVYGSGLLGGDDAQITSTSITYASRNVAYSGGNVANQTITGSGYALTGADVGNYTLSNTSSTVTGRIVPRALTVSGVSAVNRVYDGTVNVTVNINSAAVDGTQVVSGDDVSISVPGGGSVTGTVANKNVGNNKAVTVPGLALTGADALNYSLTGSNGVLVNITRKELTAQYAGQTKVYDGTTRATAIASSTDIVAGDDVRFYVNEYYNGYCAGNFYACYVNFTGSGAKNVGTDKPIAITADTIFGNDANNYTFVNAGSGTATGSVTARAITPSVTGVNKVYDGTTAATVTLNATASGIASGDQVQVGTSNAQFTGSGAKNVGTGKPVSVTGITLAGTDSSNYTLAVDTAATTAAITAKPVSVTGITAVNRVYDGTLVVAVTADTPSVSGLVVGDDVSAVLPVGGITSGTMATRHAGTGKAFSVTGVSLTGVDATNYTLAGSGGTVDIAPKPLTVSYTGVNKVYDGNTSATVSGASADIVGGVGDVVGFSQTAAFSASTGGRNAGTGKTVDVSAIALTGANAGNYTLTSTTATTTADITPKSIGVSYVGLDRLYNGVADTSASVLGSASGLVAGDSVGLNQTARFTTDGSAGNGKPVSITDIALAGVNAGNYTLTSTTASTTANILPRTLGVAGVTAIDRVYDGTTTVQVNVAGASVDLTGVLAGDTVSVSLPPAGLTTGEMADRHAGVDKAVSIAGLLLGGSSAGNYILTGDDALTVTISPKAVSASYTGIDKIYDGGVFVSVSGSSTGFITGDTVNISASGSFTGTGAKNVGSGKAVAVTSALLTGADRLNYTLSNPTGSTTASITPRTLTAVYTGGERVYDGTVAAPVTGSLANRVGSDVLTLSQTAVFTGAGAKDVGSGKPIAVSDIAIGGTDAGNYVLSGTSASASGRITPRPVVIEGLSGITATDRVYDGTVVVAVNVPGGLGGTPRDGDILPGETVAVNLPPAGAATGRMADKHVGSDKPVLVDGLGLTGTDAGNYMIASASGITVDITPLTISAAYAGVNRVYDGSTAAGVSVTLAGRLTGDALTGSATGLFTDGKNVGNAKPIAVTGGLLAGADARNYLLSNPSGSTSANVTPKTVSASYTGGTREYDGTTTAPVTGSLNGLVSGDTVTLSQSAAFTGSGAKNVGSGKLIGVSAIAIAGTDAGNYSLSGTTASTTGSITPRPVVVEGLSVSAEGREYDGTTQVAVQVTASAGAGPRPGDLIAGDAVTLLLPPAGTTTGQMANKHAGTGKAIVVDGLGLTGADAGNYSIVGTSGLTVDITQRTLTASWTGVDKVYDGSNVASAFGTGDRVVAGDVLSITGAGVFDAGRNAGTGLAISITSAVFGGADAANYLLTNPTGSATAAITPKTLTVTYAGGTRVYDGTTTAPVTGTMAGLIDGDTVSLTQSAAFTGSGAKNVGSSKPVSVTGIALAGADAANYRSNIAATATTASVTPRPVVIEGLSATATSREYDGTTAVSVDLVAASGVAPRTGDLIAGDDVTVSVPGTGGTFGTMADKHVGTGKAVVIDGLGLSGADAANYRIQGVQGVTVDITARTLTASWLGDDKVYDGSTAGTARGTGDRVVAGDLLTITGQGVFTAGRNAGTALALEIRSATMEGADAGNYTLLNPSADVTATIRPRTVTAVYTGVDKVYDGTAAASVLGSLDNLVDGDTLTLAQTAVFSGGKNAGTGKAVLVAGISLGGTDMGNYALASTEASTTASITPKPVSVSGLSGLTAQDRVYDGTRIVALSGSVAGSGALEGAIGGDAVSLVQGGGAPTQGTMVDKHVGSGKGVVIEGLALTGADAINYVLADTLGLTVNITPRTITASGLQPVERLYDGSTVIGLNTAAAALTGAISGDDLRLRVDGATASVADRHAGVAKAVLLDGVALEGSDARNYRLSSSDDLRVTIAPKPLTLTAQDLSKTYGDTLVPTGTAFSSEGLVAGEVVDRLLLASDGLAATAAAGSYSLYATGVEGSSGFDVANYLVSYQAAALLVNPRPLTLTALLRSKRYGEVLGFSGSEFSANSGGLANGDTIGSVLLDSAGTVGTAAVGDYGIAISGASGGSFTASNYTISYQAGTLRVDPRPLSVATRSVVRYADEPNPTSFGFSTGPGQLVNGDSVASVLQPVPPGSVGAPGGSLFELLPSNAQFGTGSAANYEVSYVAGLLVVLPKPPRIDDPDGGTTGASGDPQFAIVLDPEELARAEAALRRQSSVAGGGDGGAPAGGSPAGEAGSDTDAQAAAVIAALLRGETQQVSLPVLLRLPLISMDPNLRRLILGAVTTP